MSKMNYSLDAKGIKDTIFFDQNYVSILMMMDSLVSNFDFYKMEFYNFLRNGGEGEIHKLNQ